MPRKSYAQKLSEIKPNPLRCVGMSREQIEVAINDISETMKGPMSNTERAALFGDRLDYRAGLVMLVPVP